MMVHTIGSEAGLSPHAAVFGSEHSGNRTLSLSSVGSSNSSSDFYEHFVAAIAGFGTFQDRVNQLVRELQLENYRTLTSKRNNSAAEELEKAPANPDDSGESPEAEIGRIQPALLALLAISETHDLDVLA